MALNESDCQCNLGGFADRDPLEIVTIKLLFLCGFFFLTFTFVKDCQIG